MDAFLVDHVIDFFRGVLWLTGTSIGAYLCFRSEEKRPLLTFLGCICLAGVIFNIFVVAAALLILFGVVSSA